MSLCLFCGKTNPPYKHEDARTPVRKVCSPHCRAKFISKNNGSRENRLKQSLAKRAEKNPNWLGDEIKSISALHNWVRRRIPKPEYCELCGIVPPRDLANKGRYIRDLDQWEWLCRRCHMTKDGRLGRLLTGILKRGHFREGYYI